MSIWTTPGTTPDYSVLAPLPRSGASTASPARAAEVAARRASSSADVRRLQAASDAALGSL